MVSTRCAHYTAVGYYKYYALHKTLSRVEGFSWTEPYTSIPDIWGPLTSVSAPVYDKSRGDVWHMIGGVAVVQVELLG